MSQLDGRVIAIAGATGGLGPVVATKLASEGATLALIDRDQAKLDEVVAALGLPEERVDVRVLDLLDLEAVEGWVAALTERFGHVDGLAHLVGGWRGGKPVTEAPLEDYDWLEKLLVRTVIHTTRAFHDALVASEHGRFVIVSSAEAAAPSATNAFYGATKAAAEALTFALADSFRRAESKATANVLVINAILTEQMRAANPDKDYSNFTPAEDLATAIAFLCSDAGSRMNGKRLPLHP